jgi:PPOX class probable F420-dependent enzyme
MPERFADPKIQGYLDEKAVIILGTVDADGAPLITPMWFVHDLEALVMVTPAGTRKARNLLRDPRVAVVAESGDRVGIRRVTIAGRAEPVREPAEQQRLADRLMEKYDPYVERMWRGRRLPDDRLMFRILPRAVSSAGLDR